MASHPEAGTSPCTGQTPFFHQAVLEFQILHGGNILIGQAIRNETLCITWASALLKDKQNFVDNKCQKVDSKSKKGPCRYPVPTSKIGTLFDTVF